MWLRVGTSSTDIFGHRVTHIFYVTETILGPCPFRIYMVFGVHLS